MTSSQRMKTGLVLTSLAALLGAGVAGCGAGDGHAAGDFYDVGTKSEATTKKCGADRYTGPQGMDVSSWQGSFTFTGKGLAFAIARVSDGTQYPDPQFASNWKKMKAAGLLRGAYQFFEPAQNATTQANMVVQAVGQLGAGDLPAALDFEKTGGQSASTIVSKIKTWMSVVQAGTGKKPMIYTTGSFWESNTGNSGAFSSYPLWVAHWGTTCPNIPTTWSNWTFWQYCDGTSAYCSNATGVDRDVFNGTLAQLKAFAGGTTTPYYGASYVNQSWPLASTALQMQPGQTIASYITLKNTGTKAWDSNTRLGTTQPRDRASAFADSSWINDHRPAGVSGTVAPGSNYKFQFNFHAPLQTGDYHEYFGVLEEGVAWFSDSGQGGPPDNQIQAWIHVSGTPVGTGGAGGTGAGGSPGTGGAAGSSSGGSAGAAGAPGTGGSGAFPGGGGSAGAAGGNSETTHTLGNSNNSGGCGCRLADESPGNTGAPLLLLFGLGWIIRRRRS